MTTNEKSGTHANQDIFGQELEDICASWNRPRILSLGNGRASEAERILSPGSNRKPREFVVFDEDPSSLSFLGRKYRNNGVVRIGGSPGDLIEQSANLGRFEFIYSTSILGKLETNAAQNVVAALTLMLKPGGRLLLANPAPSYEYTDLTPVYRTEFDMAKLTARIPETRIAGHLIYCDPSQRRVFLEVHNKVAAAPRRAAAVA